MCRFESHITKGSKQTIFPLLSGTYIEITDFMSDNTQSQIKTPAPMTQTKLSEKYSDAMGKVNETLGKVD